jgi:hypothetical protein
MGAYNFDDFPKDGSMAVKEDGRLFSPKEAVQLANDGRTEDGPEETILYSHKPGVPREDAAREMTFSRLFETGGKYRVEQSEILDGFFDAPGRKINKNGHIVGELAPGKPKFMQPVERPAIDYNKVLRSPCCGAEMKYVNRTRARCIACGVEYQDNYA